MKLFKGFDKDMECRGFQFEEGKSYHEEKAKLCDAGFHACEMPLDVFHYYQPGEKSIYREVELEDVTDEHGDDSKRVGKTIKIGANIGIRGLVAAQLDFVFKKSEKEQHCTSGEESSAATKNKNGIAVACGKNARSKGVLGSHIVVTEWDKKSENILAVCLGQIDGETLKPDTWYTVKDGKFVEVPE